MKKILMSLTTISAMAALVVGATGAFFSDVETSAGNTFEAGSIDLKLDNTSYLSTGRDSEGQYLMVKSTDTSWGEDAPIDLINSGKLFFNFHDLKPEDLGEDTISLHVESNKAWACLDIAVTEDKDMSCTNAEIANDSQCSNPDGNGELDQQLQFLFWRDDGDNVLEEGEQLLTTAPYTVEQLNGANKWKLADSDSNEVGVVADNTAPLDPVQTYYIGKAWCFGTISVPAQRLTQDSGGPDTRGPGVDCDGSQVNNAAQTDKVVGTLTFTAYQYRNNENFTCASQR